MQPLAPRMAGNIALLEMALKNGDKQMKIYDKQLML
jgi:hypothetical protein